MIIFDAIGLREGINISSFLHILVLFFFLSFLFILPPFILLISIYSIASSGIISVFSGSIFVLGLNSKISSNGFNELCIFVLIYLGNI